MYQNAVKSYESLLFTYIDKEYTTAIKTLDKNYKDTLNNAITKLKSRFKNSANPNPKALTQYNKDVEAMQRQYALKNMPLKYDKIFRELLALTYRAKFIGGNDLIKVKN
jgi:molecular chaperone DnaK (HSP70)